jgi:hypothetical protein
MCKDNIAAYDRRILPHRESGRRALRAYNQVYKALIADTITIFS